MKCLEKEIGKNYKLFILILFHAPVLKQRKIMIWNDIALKKKIHQILFYSVIIWKNSNFKLYHFIFLQSILPFVANLQTKVDQLDIYIFLEG